MQSFHMSYNQKIVTKAAQMRTILLLEWSTKVAQVGPSAAT